MKKFVTLSAVALAGATIGVGSTFGWWADDASPSKPDLPADSSLTPPKPAEPTPTLAPLDAPVAPVLERIEISGPDEVRGEPTPSGEFHVMPQFYPASNVPISVGISRHDADRLTRELIKESEELEKQGQKEAAQIHRKLISRLQRTPRRTGPVPVPSNIVNVVPAYPGTGMSSFPPDYTPATPVPNVTGGLSAPRVEYRTVIRRDDLAVTLGQRAATIESEATQLEEHGQKELANEKRKLAAQLRDIEKQFPDQAVKVVETRNPPGPSIFSSTAAVPPANAPVTPMDMSNEVKIAALVRDLEREAKTLEVSGRKSEAEIKRNLARGLRSALKELPDGREDLVEKEHLQAAVRSLKAEIHNLQSSVAPPEPRGALNDSQPESKSSAEIKLHSPPRQRVDIEKVMNVSGPIELDGLQKKLAKLFPNSAIDLFSMSPSQVRIKLQAPDSKEALRILQIAHGEILIQQGNRDLAEGAHPVQKRPQPADVTLDIPVQRFDYEKLLQKLKKQFPQSKLRLLQESPGTDKMVITGSVSDSDEVTSIRQFIQGEVVNQRRETAVHAIGGQFVAPSAPAKGRDDTNEIGNSISVPSGMRLVSLPASTTQNAGESIRAGSRVDVTLTAPVPAGSAEGPKTKRILSSAVVFATGPKKGFSPSGEQQEGVQVSLVVSAADAQMLMRSFGDGTLHLSLSKADASSGDSHTRRGDESDARRPEKGQRSHTAQLKEVHGLLRALQHEIGLLRSDLRDLRGVIKEESRNPKIDPDAKSKDADQKAKKDDSKGEGSA